MKKMLLFAGILSGIFSYSQDCTSYYYLQDKKTVEVTIYNKKGDPDSKLVYQISDVKNAGGTTTASVQTEMFDKKGKTIAKGNSIMKCTGGVMMIDMKMMLPQQQAEQFKAADVKAENMYIEYPLNMSKGDQLKDGTLTMDMDNNGLKQSLAMTIEDRKVEDKETVTTTAGTWNCYKISYKTKINMRMMGVGVPFNMEGVEWYAPGFGIVKTQSKYGGTELTAIK